MKRYSSFKFQVSSVINRWAITAAVLPAVLLVSSTSSAADPTVDEIITKANEAAYYAGTDGQADVKMTIIDAGGENVSASSAS